MTSYAFSLVYPIIEYLPKPVDLLLEANSHQSCLKRPPGVQAAVEPGRHQSLHWNQQQPPA